MHHYSQGTSTRQAHKGIPEGHFEEEQGLGGFYGPVSHLIKPKPSTRWTRIEGNLRPRMFDPVKFKGLSQQRMFFNNDIVISMEWRTDLKNVSAYARRNADGDTLYFCHKGRGTLLSEYGCLKFTPGSYLVVPKCLTHAFWLEENTQFLRIDSKTGHYREPDRGMVGKNAVYDANAIGMPDLEMQWNLIKSEKIDVKEVNIQHTSEITKFFYDSQIFDAEGWKGDLYPFSLHMDHLNPLMSHRVHLPPSAHTTFVTNGFVVCSFLPRPLESDADALKVPFYHQNIDYDEILFYHAGDFFSRDNLHPGMLSFHPAGFAHGPHPKAMKSVGGKTHTDEYAVMIDTRWPLQRDPKMAEVELEQYWQSWQPKP